MTLLDRTIARHFLFNTLLLLALLFTLIVAIDFSLNFDEFTEKASVLAKQWGWAPSKLREMGLAVALLLDLWWPRLFQLYNYMLGVVLVAGMGFTAAQMVKHREFVAMLAGGISLHRVIRPMLIVAGLLVVAQAANTEFMLPRLAPLLTRDKKDAGERSLRTMRLNVTPDAAGRLFFARDADLERGVLTGVWIWERDERGLLKRRIQAESAAWDGHAWVLTNGVGVRPPRPNEATGVLAEPVASVQSDLDPTSLRMRRFEGYAGSLSTGQLAQLQAKLASQPDPLQRRLDSLERLRFGRLAALLCNLLSLLVCIPFFVRREPAAMITQSLKCAPVALVCVVGGLLAATANVPGLPPALGVFVPVLVLIPLAIASITSIRT